VLTIAVILLNRLNMQVLLIDLLSTDYHCYEHVLWLICWFWQWRRRRRRNFILPNK